MLRATKIAEENGIPGVAIVSTGFMKQARATARAMGVPDISIAEYPGVIPMDSADVLADTIGAGLGAGVLYAWGIIRGRNGL